MDRLSKLSKDELLAYIYFEKNQVSLMQADKYLSKYISTPLGEVAAKLLSLKLISYVGSEMIVVVNSIGI